MSRETETASLKHAQKNPDVREPALPRDQLPCRLNRHEAAKFLTEAGLPIAATTLAKRAVQGNGPPYSIWNGRALYRVGDLIAWAQHHIGPDFANTAERSTMSHE